VSNDGNDQKSEPNYKLHHIVNVPCMFLIVSIEHHDLEEFQIFKMATMDAFL